MQPLRRATLHAEVRVIGFGVSAIISIKHLKIQTLKLVRTVCRIRQKYVEGMGLLLYLQSQPLTITDAFLRSKSSPLRTA